MTSPSFNFPQVPLLYPVDGLVTAVNASIEKVTDGQLPDRFATAPLIVSGGPATPLCVTDTVVPAIVMLPVRLVVAAFGAIV
jgi:hypothetical protein